MASGFLPERARTISPKQSRGAEQGSHPPCSDAAKLASARKRMTDQNRTPANSTRVQRVAEPDRELVIHG